MSPSSTPERVRRTPRSDVRAGILRAAAGVFAERGYAASSVEQIAAVAGFSKGAVYSNFASKDDVFFALLELRSAERRALVENAVDAPSVARLVADANDADDGWLLLLIEFWAHAARDVALRERLDAHRAPLRAAIAVAITSLADRDGRELPLPAEELALAAVALTNGLAMERTADGSPASALVAKVLPLVLGGSVR